MRNFFSEMLSCKRKIYEKRDRVLADLYLKVQTFVESGVYSTCKKAKDIANLTLKGYDARYIAEKFGKAYDTIRTEKRLISNELWRIFPKDFFEKFLDYRNNKLYVDECLNLIDTFDLTSDKLILLDVLKTITYKDSHKQQVEAYDLKDLKYEIDFFQRYSKEFFEKDLSTVDVDKLRYIIDVLDGNISNPSVRSGIIKELKGGM